MIKMSPQDFAKVMNFLGQAYNKEFDRNQLNVWYTFFESETIEDFKAAITRLISKNKFIPSIAEIKEEINTLHHSFLQLTADDEWHKVQKAIGKYGFYNSTEAEASLDPFTAKVVRNMGGFRAICMAEDNEWTRKNFMRLWDDMQDRRKTTLQYDPKYLTTQEKLQLEDQQRPLLTNHEEMRKLLHIGEDDAI